MEEKTAKLEWLNDPQVFSVNRISAHSDHQYYETNQDAEEGDMRLRQMLNGTWQFSFAEKPEERVKEFYEKDFNADKFDSIWCLDILNYRDLADASISIPCIRGTEFQI